jgi:hypothetical protein
MMNSKNKTTKFWVEAENTDACPCCTMVCFKVFSSRSYESGPFFDRDEAEEECTRLTALEEEAP